MPKPHIFIDIEALAQTPDAAPIELAAVLFNPETAEILREFERIIIPNPWMRKEAETLKWHAERGSFPFTEEREAKAVPLLEALLAFKTWVQALGEFESVWSWGSTYDFPILATAGGLEEVALPWHYAQQECARTIWRRAFGDRKHDPRPHHALEDCHAGVRDLCEAWQAIKGRPFSTLVEIGEHLRTQDNRATANPSFCVQVLKRHGPIMLDYGTGEVMFHDHEECETYYQDGPDPVRWEELQSQRDLDELPDHITAASYVEVWETVQTCFTEEGCKQYLERDGHNLRCHHGVRIYAESFYRNVEMLAIRNALMTAGKEVARG